MREFAHRLAPPTSTAAACYFGSMARPSRTALKIARFMLLLDDVPRLAPVLPAGAAADIDAILRASGAVSARAIDVMRRPWAHRVHTALERWTGRGQLLWFGLRKRWFADTVAQAIADGATQLLVVGAGFDPLAARIAARHPHVTCLEIDAPATAEPKRAGLRGAGLLRPNLHVCAADLAARPLAAVLGDTPWRRDARSIVVAEGLLMYLAAADVAAFLHALRDLTGPASRLAFSAMYAHPDGRPRLPVLDRTMRLALRLAGEPLRWGIEPPDLPAFVAASGFRVRAQVDAEALRAAVLAPLGLGDEPVLPYEHLALIEPAA